MSNIENCSNKLKITGYIHPIKPISNKSIYKTFNTESKQNAYLSAKTKYAYATFTDKNSYMKQSHVCPECGEDALYKCDCEFKDKHCSKGHIWYINTKGYIEKGDPHN